MFHRDPLECLHAGGDRGRTQQATDHFVDRKGPRRCGRQLCNTGTRTGWRARRLCNSCTSTPVIREPTEDRGQALTDLLNYGRVLEAALLQPTRDRLDAILEARESAGGRVDPLAAVVGVQPSPTRRAGPARIDEKPRLRIDRRDQAHMPRTPSFER